MIKSNDERERYSVVYKYAFVKRCARTFVDDTAWPLWLRLWQFKKTPVYADEFHVVGDGKSMHVVRTMLTVREATSSKFSVRPSSFY